MKQIIKEYTEIKKISVKNIYSHGNITSQTIIAYVTASGDGMAVLTDNGEGSYGFIYHKDLVLSKYRRDLKYQCDTKNGAIRNVLDASRQLLIFDDFNEFVNFAANKTKL